MLLREIIAERDGQARSTEVLIDSLQTMVAAREAQQGGGGGGKRDE